MAASRASPAYYDPTFPIGSPVSPTTRPSAPTCSSSPTAIRSAARAASSAAAQVGYNFQFNQFLIGAETDFQGTSLSGGGNNAPLTLFPSPYSTANSFLTPIGAITGANISLPWFGTVRGRVGYLFTPTLLIYGTAGFAYGQVDAFGFNNTRTGWTAGGGVEWMFAPHWSAKVEYLYVDLSSNGHDRHLRLDLRPALPSAAQRRARWRELSLQLRGPGSGRRQVLIG